MGIEVYLCWIDPQTSKETWDYVLKLYYPTQFNYSQAEIPDGNCPRDLDVKYLGNYLDWIAHLKFMAEKLPGPFMDQMKSATTQTYNEILVDLDQDYKRIQTAMNNRNLLRTAGVKCWLSVG